MGGNCYWYSLAGKPSYFFITFAECMRCNVLVSCCQLAAAVCVVVAFAILVVVVVVVTAG
jgi:hypothetical protein